MVNPEGEIVQACGLEYPRSGEHIFEPNPQVMIKTLQGITDEK